jgi:cold shock protein
MRVGTVKWFDYHRGFGFITSPEGDEVMVHHAIVKGKGPRCLHRGEQVEFEAIRGPKGWLATTVRQMNNASSVSTTNAPSN